MSHATRPYRSGFHGKRPRSRSQRRLVQRDLVGTTACGNRLYDPNGVLSEERKHMGRDLYDRLKGITLPASQEVVQIELRVTAPRPPDIDDILNERPAVVTHQVCFGLLRLGRRTLVLRPA